MACCQNKISHDPVKMLDESFEHIPESWRHSMQLIRPVQTGLFAPKAGRTSLSGYCLKVTWKPESKTARTFA